MNCTLLEKVRCMLSSSILLRKEFRVEALSYASHLINRLPIATNKEKTPLEVLSGCLLMIMIAYMLGLPYILPC